MRKVLDREAETKIIHATSTATLPISAKYIEDGFIATRNFQDHGESIFEIVRDDSLKFKACEMSKEDIVSLYLRHSLEMEEPDGDLVIKQADFQDGLDFSLLDDDFVLTRYFQNTNDSKWYAVFERVKESEQEE
ncbi:hypothetical protein H6775_01235 [Candidatus Nomurabacteria bacterium]|nr:hypothetical protein [Candidatus Nomurabacteria bacterium]